MYVSQAFPGESGPPLASRLQPALLSRPSEILRDPHYNIPEQVHPKPFWLKPLQRLSDAGLLVCVRETQDSELPADKQILFITTVRSASHSHCPHIRPDRQRYPRHVVRAEKRVASSRIAIRAVVLSGTIAW